MNEAYLRLVPPDAGWASRAQFFKTAAMTMRHVLIDRARERGAAKRGGGWRRLTLEGATLVDEGGTETLEGILDLDEALSALERAHPSHAELVVLRFYSGLSLREAAEILGLPLTTADRTWAYARAWLYRRLEEN